MSKVPPEGALRMDDDFEAAVLNGLRSGDNKLFGSWWRRNQGAFLATAVKMTKDHALAEDIVQQAAIQALARIDQFRGESRLSTWANGIVVNVSLGRMRTRRRDILAITDPFALYGGHDSRTPESHMIQAQMARDADKVMSVLHEKDAQVLTRHASGEKMHDIAASLGWSVPMIKSRMNRARVRLRRSFPELGEYIVD